MTSPDVTHLTVIRDYLHTLASGTDADTLARFFTADAQQIELPNRLNPNGGRSDLPTLLSRAKSGQALLRSQTYDIVSSVVEGDWVAVEALWTAVLAVPLGTLAVGSTMKAHFAMFFEFRDGRIALQRNYDCFEPW